MRCEHRKILKVCLANFLRLERLPVVINNTSISCRFEAIAIKASEFRVSSRTYLAHCQTSDMKLLRKYLTPLSCWLFFQKVISYKFYQVLNMHLKLMQKFMIGNPLYLPALHAHHSACSEIVVSNGWLTLWFTHLQ